MKKTVFMKKGALIDSCQKADATERRKTLHKKKRIKVILLVAILTSKDTIW